MRRDEIGWVGGGGIFYYLASISGSGWIKEGGLSIELYLVEEAMKCKPADVYSPTQKNTKQNKNAAHSWHTVPAAALRRKHTGEKHYLALKMFLRNYLVSLHITSGKG